MLCQRRKILEVILFFFDPGETMIVKKMYQTNWRKFQFFTFLARVYGTFLNFQPFFGFLGKSNCFSVFWKMFRNCVFFLLRRKTENFKKKTACVSNSLKIFGESPVFFVVKSKNMLTSFYKDAKIMADIRIRHLTFGWYNCGATPCMYYASRLQFYTILHVTSKIRKKKTKLRLLNWLFLFQKIFPRKIKWIWKKAFKISSPLNYAELGRWYRWFKL